MVPAVPGVGQGLLPGARQTFLAALSGTQTGSPRAPGRAPSRGLAGAHWKRAVGLQSLECSPRPVLSEQGAFSLIHLENCHHRLPWIPVTRLPGLNIPGCRSGYPVQAPLTVAAAAQGHPCVTRSAGCMPSAPDRGCCGSTPSSRGLFNLLPCSSMSNRDEGTFLQVPLGLPGSAREAQRGPEPSCHPQSPRPRPSLIAKQQHPDLPLGSWKVLELTKAVALPGPGFTEGEWRLEKRS